MNKLFGFHIRILPFLHRNKRFFDILRGRPTEQIMRSSGLIISTGQTAATEGLLSYDSTGALIIDIEISGRKLQPLGGVVQEIPINKQKMSE
jgi:hypothetical protein